MPKRKSMILLSGVKTVENGILELTRRSMMGCRFSRHTDMWPEAAVMENSFPKYSLAADSTVGAVREAFSFTIWNTEA